MIDIRERPNVPEFDVVHARFLLCKRGDVNLNNLNNEATKKHKMHISKVNHLRILCLFVAKSGGNCR